MLPFNSKRERNLWILAAIVQAAIFASASLAARVASSVRENDLSAVSFITTLVLVGLAVTLISTRRQPILTRIGLAIGVIAIYWMAAVRIEVMEERTHLFEYSLVGVLVYQALAERGVRLPSAWAVGVTALLGLADEIIQLFVPGRFFDWRDVGFNALAGLMAVALSAGIGWLGQRGKTSPQV